MFIINRLSRRKERKFFNVLRHEGFFLGILTLNLLAPTTVGARIKP